MKLKLILFITLLLSADIAAAVKEIESNVDKVFRKEKFGRGSLVKVAELKALEHGMLRGLYKRDKRVERYAKDISKEEQEASETPDPFLTAKNFDGVWFYTRIQSLLNFKDMNELGVSIKIEDSKGNDLSESNHEVRVMKVAGTKTTYFYYFIVKSKTPLNKDHYKDLDNPVYLICNFGNNKQIKSLIKF